MHSYAPSHCAARHARRVAPLRCTAASAQESRRGRQSTQQPWPSVLSWLHVWRMQRMQCMQPIQNSAIWLVQRMQRMQCMQSRQLELRAHARLRALTCAFRVGAQAHRQAAPSEQQL